ncbi:hypothetical protein TNCV_3430881 [Trichonephila clavipes]|nr:hypothetical protein TNCV_3430881 [Trichonephila clavipes]
MASIRCYVTSARGHGAIVYCLNSGSADTQTGSHNGDERRALPWIERTWEESPGWKEREESPKGRRTDIGVKRKER